MIVVEHGRIVESTTGRGAVAVFRSTAVAIHPDLPHASPRNVIPVTIAEMDIHETTVESVAQTNPMAAKDLPPTSPPPPTSTSHPNKTSTSW